MDTWSSFVHACLIRHGVGDPDLAARHGVPRERYYARTGMEQWRRALPGIRVHPAASASVQQQLVVVCASSDDLAAAAGESAAWLHGLREWPPARPLVVGHHATRCRAYARVDVRRARWLEASDVTLVDEVPTLAVPAMLITLLRADQSVLRHRLVDAVHRGLTTPDEVLARLGRVGPVANRALLKQRCRELGRRRVESVFQEDVAKELARLGYRPELSAMRIQTPSGIPLVIDIPLLPWLVAVEPDGDRFHRTREQRLRDRRRLAAFAATDWVRVPVDWGDWHQHRDSVLRSIDGAIEAQRRRGIGATIPPPRGIGATVPQPLRH